MIYKDPRKNENIGYEAGLHPFDEASSLRNSDVEHIRGQIENDPLTLSSLIEEESTKSATQDSIHDQESYGQYTPIDEKSYLPLYESESFNEDDEISSSADVQDYYKKLVKSINAIEKIESRGKFDFSTVITVDKTPDQFNDYENRPYYKRLLGLICPKNGRKNLKTGLNTKEKKTPLKQKNKTNLLVH